MKSLFFLFVFFFIHAISFCQTAEQLDSQVVALYNQSEFEKAVLLAEKSIEIINSSGGENHPEYPYAINNLAMLYKKTGNYQKAKPLYKIISENKNKKYGEISEEYGASENFLAIIYEMLQQYDSAIILYKHSISIFEKINKKNETYLDVVENIATLYKKTERYFDAKSIQKIKNCSIMTRVKNMDLRKIS